MKNLLLILPLSIGLVSCGPSLSKDSQARLEKEVSKKTLSYYTKKGENLSIEKLSPSGSDIVDEIELSLEEEDNIAKEVQAAAMFGAKDFKLEVNKYNLQVNYKAPQEGFVKAGGEYFASESVLSNYLNQKIKNQTTKKVCAKKERSRYSYHATCVKHKTVKVKDADKKEQALREKYAEVKVHKKDQALEPKDYTLGISSMNAKGTEQVRIKLTKQNKRDIASLQK